MKKILLLLLLTSSFSNAEDLLSDPSLCPAVTVTQQAEAEVYNKSWPNCTHLVDNLTIIDSDKNNGTGLITYFGNLEELDNLIYNPDAVSMDWKYSQRYVFIALERVNGNLSLNFSHSGMFDLLSFVSKLTISNPLDMAYFGSLKNVDDLILIETPNKPYDVLNQYNTSSFPELTEINNELKINGLKRLKSLSFGCGSFTSTDMTTPLLSLF